MKEPLVTKPFGPTEDGPHYYYGYQIWNLDCSGTSGGVTCEICGTDLPELVDESYHLFTFFGRQGVEECCGRIIDEMYQVAAREFTESYLHEFAENPADPAFVTLRTVLKEVLEKAKLNMKKVSEEIRAMNVP